MRPSPTDRAFNNQFRNIMATPISTDTIKKLCDIVTEQHAKVCDQLCATAQIPLQMSSCNNKTIYFWHAITETDTAEIEKFEKLLLKPIEEQALALGVNFSCGWEFCAGSGNESHWISSDFELID
jgi:hypothetical protein